MKHPVHAKNAFVELRAQGLTFRAIAARIDVPKSTLQRWDAECWPQIQRLRALEWEAVEAQLGRRMEDDLKALAARIHKWEAVLDRIDPECCDLRDVLRVVRECRREYLRRRAVLMAPLEGKSRHRPAQPDQPAQTPDDGAHPEQPRDGSALPVAEDPLLPSSRWDKTGQNSCPRATTPLISSDLEPSTSLLSQSPPALCALPNADLNR
jgi:hypothetical protein